MATIPTCCITGGIPGDGGACGDCDPCIMGEAHIPEPVKRLIAEKNSIINENAELHGRLSAMRETLFMVAPSHQGGHSATGAAIAECLGIPFPVAVPDLERTAAAEGFDPKELWPWLYKMRATSLR